VYRLLIILHLLGASVWVGGHLVLSLVVLPRALHARDASIVREFESGYERASVFRRSRCRYSPASGSPFTGFLTSAAGSRRLRSRAGSSS